MADKSINASDRQETAIGINCSTAPSLAGCPYLNANNGYDNSVNPMDEAETNY